MNTSPSHRHYMQVVVDLRTEADRTVCETITIGKHTQRAKYVLPDFEILTHYTVHE